LQSSLHYNKSKCPDFHSKISNNWEVNLAIWGRGSWHKGIRHNLHFPSIGKGTKTERGINGKRDKGKKHNSFFSKPERGSKELALRKEA
jgi:hypothetical protein